MGCDIHAFIEEKYLHKDTYRCVAKLFLNRDYYLFALLAGVRYKKDFPCTPMYEPKGIPCDLSYQVNYDYEKWKDDAHSSSVLSLDEVSALAASMVFEDRLDEHTKHEVRILAEMMEGLNKPRLVFWFDC